jgi:hypothetical protein
MIFPRETTSDRLAAGSGIPQFFLSRRAQGANPGNALAPTETEHPEGNGSSKKQGDMFCINHLNGAPCADGIAVNEQANEDSPINGLNHVGSVCPIHYQPFATLVRYH